MAIRFVDHMDEVLREALVVPDADAFFQGVPRQGPVAPPPPQASPAP